MVNMRNWKKSLRYFRWAVKVIFLLLFIVPVAYLIGAPQIPVTSQLVALPTTSYLMMPVNQAVCSIWTISFDNTNPGAWILCPVGAAQLLLTGAPVQIPNIIIAMLLFLFPIILFGNFFCGWACPVGTMIDIFDKGVEKFLPKVEAKREKRNQKKRQKKHWEQNSPLVCPSCPIGKIMSKRYGVLANGVFAASLLGSAILRFPIFCAVCPIGIVTRGMFHLRSILSITGKSLTIFIELWAIPIVAVVASIRERRYWCKKLCPVGALLNGAGALNPFIKPRVKEERCIMKGCPEDCEDYHIDFCGWCRLMDDYKCEKVCPVDIDLVNHGSLARCTKCLECYIVCDYNAISMDAFGKPDVIQSIKRLYNRIQRHPS
jgi:ferredoxin-type protein NapH